MLKTFALAALWFACPQISSGAVLPNATLPIGTLVLAHETTSSGGTILEIYRAGASHFQKVWSHAINTGIREFEFKAFESGKASLFLLHGTQGPEYIAYVDLQSPTSAPKALYSVQDPVALSNGWDGSILIATQGGGLVRMDDSGKAKEIMAPGVLRKATQARWDFIHEVTQNTFVTVSNAAETYEFFDFTVSKTQPAFSSRFNQIQWHNKVQRMHVKKVRQVLATPMLVWMDVDTNTGERAQIGFIPKNGQIERQKILQPGTELRFLAGDGWDLTRSAYTHLQEYSGWSGKALQEAVGFFTDANLNLLGLPGSSLASKLHWSWPQTFPDRRVARTALVPKITIQSKPEPTQIPAEKKPAVFILPKSFTARELAHLLSAYSPASMRAPDEMREQAQSLTSTELRKLGLEPYGQTYDLIPGKESMVITSQEFEAFLRIAAERAQRKAARCAAQLKTS